MATVFTQTALTMDAIDEILPTPQLEEKNSMSNLQVTSHLEWNLSQNSANSILCQPFKFQYPLTNSANWSPYISLKNWKDQTHFTFGDHFTTSHNLFPWLCLYILGRKLMLVTLRILKV